MVLFLIFNFGVHVTFLGFLCKGYQCSLFNVTFKSYDIKICIYKIKKKLCK